MSVNFRLAREIYGTPWAVDFTSFLALSNILTDIRNGVALDNPEQKLNSFSFLNVKSEARVITRQWQLNNSEDFEGIAIINLDGPITKGGGTSSYGTKEISANMLSMAKDRRVKGFMIVTDSGGGSTQAVAPMTNAINEIKKTKPVYSLVDATAGSAAYAIISPSTKIYSTSEMNIVGSLGTMLEIEGHKANSESSDGTKHIRLYASKAVMKNKGFEEALNNDNYEFLIDDFLNPINESFLAEVIANRPALSGTTYDDGHTVFAKDAIGTFIDGIASFDEVVNMVLADAKTLNSGISNTNNNPNSNSKMTRDELKSSHPDVHAAVVQEGVTAERERVNSWLAYQEADPKAVMEGIKNGKEITQAQSHAFLVAMSKKGIIENLQKDSTKPVAAAESTTVETKENEEPKGFNFKL